MPPEAIAAVKTITIFGALAFLGLYGILTIFFKILDGLYDPTKEKESQIKYQDIVYELCNAIDNHLGHHTTEGSGILTENLTSVVSRELHSFRALRKDADPAIRDLRHAVKLLLADVENVCDFGTRSSDPDNPLHISVTTAEMVLAETQHTVEP